MDPINKSDIPTLLNSGASDHCFANITLFTSYIPFEQPLPGLTAEKGLTFNVEGKGNIELQTYINGERRTITFENALYTPGFRSNLILIARLSIKEAEVYFKDNKSIIRTKNRTDIISVIHLELLYVVNMDRIQPTSFTAQSKWKPTNFATWHRCLSHARIETIHQMIIENPIDGLNVYQLVAYVRIVFMENILLTHTTIVDLGKKKFLNAYTLIYGVHLKSNQPVVYYIL